MTGVEIAAVAYLFAWAKRRAKPMAERAGTEADVAAGLAMDRLHDLVVDKLGPQDRGLARLEKEAADGREEPAQTSAEAMAGALKAEAADDPDFAAALAQAVAELRAAQGRNAGAGGGGTVSGNAFHGPTAIQIGTYSTQTNHFGL